MTFACFLLPAHAQTRAIDSVTRLMGTAKTDTARINLSNVKIHLLVESNLDSAIAYGKMVLEEAQRLGYKKGQTEALLNLATAFSMKGYYADAKRNLEAAEGLANALDDSLLIIKVYSGYGMLYGVQSKYDTSMIYYQKTIGISERHGQLKMLRSSYGNLAIGYLMQSNFPVALLYQQKSLQLAESQHDISGQAYTLMNMGSTYQNIGDTARSEQVFLKGIALAKSVDLKNVELYGYSNISALYDALKKFDNSYAYAIKAAALAKQTGDASIEAASYAKAAMAHAKEAKYADATSLAAKAIRIADSASQPLAIYQAYSTMGAILKLQGKYKEAIPLLEKSLHTQRTADQYDESVATTNADLSLCYEKIGAYSNALHYYKTSAQMMDSIRGKENIRKATELSMKYDFEKKQGLADLLQAKKNAQVRTRQTLLIAGIAFAFLLALAAWTALRNKRKANHVLENQKAKVESTLTQLKATQAQLIQSEKMASLGELTAGIAHEIQNPLNFINNFSELNCELLEELEEETAKDNAAAVQLLLTNLKENEAKISHHGKRADSIVKNMLQHSRVNTGQTEPTDINRLADEYLRLSYHGLRAKDKSFNAFIETSFDPSLQKINTVPQNIGRVLLNLFNNAFYAVLEQKKNRGDDFKPTVSVRTKAVGGKIEITVNDNGIGVSKTLVDKIFQPFFTTKPPGQGTGLGLSLSYDIIKAHGGELLVKSDEGNGSTFIIQLPATTAAPVPINA